MSPVRDDRPAQFRRVTLRASNSDFAILAAELRAAIRAEENPDRQAILIDLLAQIEVGR